MRSRGISCLVWGAIFLNSLLVKTEPSAAANCALFVRAETGIALYGAAGRWWGEARGRYARGHLPAPGAIVVFQRSGHMPSGHVAIVTRVVSANEILVDHANWPRGTVGRGVSVSDTSTNHDWSQARSWIGAPVNMGETTQFSASSTGDQVRVRSSRPTMPLVRLILTCPRNRHRTQLSQPMGRPNKAFPPHRNLRPGLGDARNGA